MAHKAPLPTLAKSVAGIIAGTDPLARKIRDRSFPITVEFVTKVMSLLQMGYPGRRPRSLVDRKGRPRPTDMDLASFLVHLLQKPTIIELPSYTTALPRTSFASERHLSDRRYGSLTALSSHREFLSFGITIEDMSIMRRSFFEEDTLGAPRTFLIVAHTATWHAPWQGVSWEFRRDEANFRERYDLTEDKTHRGYQYFVHPNRRHSIFSRAHLLLKLLWQRLDDEIGHYEEVGESQTGGEPAPAVTREKGRHLLVPTFTMKLTGLSLWGEYPEAHDDSGESARSRVWFLTQMRTRVQFLLRANEYAFYLYGREQDYVASWIKNGTWHHFTVSDKYRRHASLALAPGVSLGYTVDLASKLVAAH